MGIRNFRNMGILERLVALGYLRLIKDTTVSVATTSVTIDTDENSQPFSFGKDKTLMLVSDIVGNATATYSLEFNALTSTYYTQNLTANGGTVSGARTTTNKIGNLVSGEKGYFTTNIKLTNDGYPTFQSSENQDYGTSGLILQDNVCSKSATVASFTSFVINSTVANAIGVDSRFMLFEVVN